MTDNAITFAVEADTSKFTQSLANLQNETRKFGSAFSGTISSAIRRGKSFQDTLKSMALRMSDLALQSAMKPIDNFVGNLAGSVLSSATGSLGTGATAPVIPFAKGGVVGAPTYFPMSNGVGLMGEAGAEAILPLARGSDGRMGVRSDGGDKPVNVTVNITTPDVEGFQKSRSQIATSLARTVGHGRRGL